jgi:hypothetical protein
MQVEAKESAEYLVVSFFLNEYLRGTNHNESTGKNSSPSFLLWQDEWQGAVVRLACENSGVVDALNESWIQGPAILPRQRLLLIAAVYDIQIVPFWVPSEEDMVADAASRYHHERLANLALQVSNLPKPADLRRKLSSFFTTPLRQALNATTRKSSRNIPHSADDSVIVHSHPHLQR